MSVINITDDQMERFKALCEDRPQDTKQRDTFEYLLRLAKEFAVRNEHGINRIPLKYQGATGLMPQPPEPKPKSAMELIAERNERLIKLNKESKE